MSHGRESVTSPGMLNVPPLRRGIHVTERRVERVMRIEYIAGVRLLS